MTTLLMVLGACMIGLGIGLISLERPKPQKPEKPKKCHRDKKSTYYYPGYTVDM